MNLYTATLILASATSVFCQNQFGQANTQGLNPQLFGIQTQAQWSSIQTQNPQVPVIWSALDVLRGKTRLETDAIQEILSRAVPGQDYPIYNDIPNTDFSCEKVHQPGFYADIKAGCQLIRRCDVNGIQWSYLCPNATVFNQLTLTCDWFFNVDCSQVCAHAECPFRATKFYDYANPRLYHENWALLDDSNVGDSRWQSSTAGFQTNGLNAGSQGQTLTQNNAGSQSTGNTATQNQGAWQNNAAAQNAADNSASQGQDLTQTQDNSGSQGAASQGQGMSQIQDNSGSQGQGMSQTQDNSGAQDASSQGQDMSQTQNTGGSQGAASQGQRMTGSSSAGSNSGTWRQGSFTSSRSGNQNRRFGSTRK